MPIAPHNPAADAAAVLPVDLTPRVLEPSPPAINEGPFFADDPASLGDAGPSGIVTPSTAGEKRWDDIISEQPDLTDWASERWLAAHKPLPALPSDYVSAREGYHRLAYGVVAEARRRANTKFGLRYTRGGFGTPFYGADEQVRVEYGTLVHQVGNTVTTQPITTLRAAADFLGVEPSTAAAEHDSPPLGDLDAELNATPSTGAFLASWFGLAWFVLEELRTTPNGVDPERTQLWPGHFDPAIAMGDADAGRRATYGASPGDHGHAEPYLYIGAWGAIDESDPFWNAKGFAGAQLSFRDLATGESETARALTFFRQGHERLQS